MKTITFKTLLFCCFAALFFASCNNDDDTSLTPEQRQAAFQMVKGQHEGDMMYNDLTSTDPKDQVDTLRMSWNIMTDSTMVIYQFPVSLIAESITDDALKAAIAKVEPRDLQCRTFFFNLDPVAFYISPITLEYNLNYGEADHKVQVVFYVNHPVSQGSYRTSTKFMSMQIVVAAIYIDGKQSEVLKNMVPFVFATDKK
ncbi:MAG: DUF4840 domain-containing protein [Prevotella sp.]|nr:DUF4840 domain-containing protein [Prevotella sp.]